MSSAGYINISTTDEVVHGQVKQSANFAYARIYEVSSSIQTSSENSREASRYLELTRPP